MSETTGLMRRYQWVLIVHQQRHRPTSDGNKHVDICFSSHDVFMEYHS